MRISKTLYISLPVVGALLSSCEADNSLQGGASGDVTLTVTAPTLLSPTGQNGETPASAGLYIFSDGRLADTRTIDPASPTEITIKRSARVYCVAGVPMEGLTPQTTVEEFISRTVSSPAGAAAAPMFYAGAGQLDPNDDSMKLELMRGVARIDVACADPKLVIREVILEDAPASSLIIPGEEPLREASTVSYSRKFAADFDGLLEEAFIVFETAKPVSVRVKGLYDGDPMNFTTRILMVERNKKYTLTVSGGSELQAGISIADWQEGDQGDGTLDLGENAIDFSASVIPEGVKIDKTDNSIIFPYTGVKDMKLAFRTSAPLSISRRLGDMEKISITPIQPEVVDGGFLSAFMINVPAQAKCEAGYEATIVMKGANDFFMNMATEASPFQIPTVSIGGHEWMCFNAISNNIDEQLYLPEGMTVEKMYNEHFVDCVGKFFQYGKENPFSPWTSNDPNQFADQQRDIPWQTPGRMPVPPGYHVASFAEFKDLVPNNITIPATWKCATGDSIRGTIVTLPGTLQTPSEATNAQNFLMRYVLFESLSTGAKIYFPFVGIKTNSKDEVPTQAKFRFETRTAYWIKDDRCTMLLDVTNLTDGSMGVKIKQDKWNYDGFMVVRGIKD